jgi:hypothetical protein
MGALFQDRLAVRRNIILTLTLTLFRELWQSLASKNVNMEAEEAAALEAVARWQSMKIQQTEEN